MVRRIGFVFVLGLASGVAAAGEVGAWEELFLRSHPVLVHFPIALILVALLFEGGHVVFRRGRGTENRRAICGSALMLLALGAVMAGLSAWSGWENAEHESHGSSVQSLIFLHRWLGIAAGGTGGAAVIFGLFGRRGGRKAVGLYRTLLLVSAGLVGVTGHFGGSIVWGESYLTEPLREAIFGSKEEGDGRDSDLTQGESGGEHSHEAEVVSAEMIRASFERDVRAILDARCIECHGAEEVSGRLRLHTWGEIESLIDGRAGVIVSGFPEVSEMVRRISLPEGDEDLMPGDDSGRLSEEEIAAIRDWILSLEPGVVGSSGEVEEERGGDGAIDVGDEERGLVELAMGRIRDAGGYASRVSLGDDSVVVNLSMLGSRAGDETLALLDGLEGVLVDLDLGATGVGDAGVGELGRFERLQRLDLSKTGVGNGGVAALVGLERLESLNLYGTGVDDGAVESLAAMAGLKSLFLWDSGFTGEGVAALRSRLEDCEVDFGEVGLGEPLEGGGDGA